MRAGSFVEIFADDSKLQRDLKRAANRMKAFGAGLDAAGRGLAGLGLAAAAPMALAIRSFSGFEDAMAGVAAAANPTAEEMERIKATAMAMSRELGVGPAQVAMTLGELRKAGMALDSVLGDAGTAAIQFAKVAGVDMETAAITMNNGMKLFGASATEVVDTLSRAADASSVSLQDVTESFRMGALQARDAGLNIEEAAIAFAMFGQEALIGSDAGTALKTAMNRLQTGAESAGDVMEALGIDVRDGNRNMLPMRGIIAELQKKFAGLNSETRDFALSKLFGSDAIRVGSILLRQGVEGWDAMAKSMAEGLPVSEKYAILMDTLSGSVARAWAAVQRLGIAVGEALGANLKGGIDAVVGLIDSLGEWAKANAGVIKLVALVAVGLVAAGTAFIALGAAISGAATTLGALAIGIGLLLSPMGLAVAAVAGFSAALRYGGPLIDLIGDKLATLGAALLAMGKSAASSLASLGMSAFSGLMAALASVPGLASSAFGAIRDGAGSVASAIGGFVSGEVGFLAEQFPAIAFVARNAFKAISGYVYVMSSLASRAFKDIPAVIGGAFRALAPIVTTAFAPVAFVAERAFGVATFVAGKAFDVISGGFYVLGSIAGRAFKDIQTVAGLAFRGVVGLANFTFPGVVAVVQRYGGAAASAAMATFGAIGDFIAAIPGRAMSAFSAIGSFIGQAFQAALPVAIDALGAIGGYLASIPGSIASVFGEIVANGKAAWMGLKADALAAFEGIKAALAGGDIGLAAEILWLTLRVQFQKGLNALNALWNDWGTAFRTVMSDVSYFFADMVFALPQALNAAIAAMLSALRPLADALSSLTGVNVPEMVARSGEDFAAMRAALADQKAAADEARFAGARESVAAGQEELARLQGQLQAAIDEAKAKATTGVVEEAAGAATDAAEGAVGTLGEPLTPEGLGQALERSASKVDVVGGFSAAAFRGLGIGDTIQDDQLEEQKGIKKELERLNDRARGGRLVFTA